MVCQTTIWHNTFACARDCDFAATVLKSRQFADAAESTRPKKSVRIIAKHTHEIEADGDNVAENAAYFQLLIDVMRDVMREYFLRLHPELINSLEDA